MRGVNGNFPEPQHLEAVREMILDHLDLWGELPVALEIPGSVFDSYYRYLRDQDQPWAEWLGPHMGLYYEGVELVTNGK